LFRDWIAMLPRRQNDIIVEKYSEI
jgi:hypothetical protein